MSVKSPLFWLGLLFVGLKLTGHVEWSWWWVTAPFWVAFILLVVWKTCNAIVEASKSPLEKLADRADPRGKGRW